MQSNRLQETEHEICIKKKIYMIQMHLMCMKPLTECTLETDR